MISATVAKSHSLVAFLRLANQPEWIDVRVLALPMPDAVVPLPLHQLAMRQTRRELGYGSAELEAFG
jgi:hypothetical protein